MAVPVAPRELRTCLGHFASGVTVVTGAGRDQPHGVTVNAFTAVSLDPPLVQVTLDRRTRAAKVLPEEPFAVNVLALEQLDLAWHFAGKPRIDHVDWLDDGPAPALANCAAHIYCTPWRTYDGGDHLIVLGEVTQIAVHHRPALVFHRGQFHAVGPAATDSPWVGSLDNPSAVGWFAESPPRWETNDTATFTDAWET